MNNNKGFTLIELLVVVLIIGILASMAMPQYFKAVERSRMSEAVTLLGNIAQSQQRKYLQINDFAGAFTGLDVAPQGVTDTWYTKGEDGNGFTITMDGGAAETPIKGAAYENARVVAARSAGDKTLQYDYTLIRYVAGTGTACVANNSEPAESLCADFCGMDEYPEGGCCNATQAAGECQPD